MCVEQELNGTIVTNHLSAIMLGEEAHFDIEKSVFINFFLVCLITQIIRRLYSTKNHTSFVQKKTNEFTFSYHAL